MKVFKNYWKEILLILAVSALYIAFSRYFFNAVNEFEIYSNPDTVQCYKNLTAGGRVTEWFAKLMSETGAYPPLYNVIAAFVLALTGKSWMAMMTIVNTFYLIVLLGAVYALASFLRDKVTGLIAVVLIATHPFIFGLFNKVCSDFALTAVVALSMYLLLKSDYFAKRWWSVIFAMSFGAGMMIKQPYAAFLAGPLLYGGYILMKGRSIGEGESKRLVNAGIALAIAFLIMAPYYFNIEKLKFLLRISSVEPRPATLQNIRYFTSGLIENFLGLQYIPALALGVLFLSRRAKRSSISLLLWVALPILTVLLMPHWKSYRYLLPVLPALVMISALGARSVMSKWYGKLMLAAMVLISVTSTVEMLSGARINGCTAFFTKRYKAMSYDLFTPAAEEKKLNAILTGIKRAVAGKMETDKKTIAVVFPYWWGRIGCGGESLEHYMWFNGIPLKEYTQGMRRDEYLKVMYSRDIKNIDAMICETSAPDGAVPFREVLASWEQFEGVAVSTQNRAECEAIWKKCMEIFSERKLIYKDDSTAFWMYMRPESNSKRQTGPGSAVHR